MSQAKEVTADVDYLLKEMADAIEKNGHYQGRMQPMWSIEQPDRPCCVYVNPVTSRCSSPVKALLDKEISKRAGVKLGMETVHWNDQTPTEEVLATLRGQK